MWTGGRNNVKAIWTKGDSNRRALWTEGGYRQLTEEMFNLDSPWSLEAMTSQELTERKPTPLASSARKRPGMFRKDHRVLLQRPFIRLVISFLSTKNYHGLMTARKIKLAKTTADLTIRGWQDLLALNHFYVSHSTIRQTDTIHPFNFHYDLLPNYFKQIQSKNSKSSKR